MKNIFKLIGIIAIVAVIGFGFVACDDGGGGTETLTYKGKGATSGDTYTLTIKKTAARAFTPIAGDEFELTDGTDKSKGTVNSFNGTNFTLQPSNQGSPTFGATVSGNNLTGLSGTITLTDGKTVTVSETITPVTPVTPPSGNNTWTLVTNSTFGTSYVNAIAYGNGKFVAGGGKIATSTDGKTWTEVPNSTSIDAYAIVYGNGKFVSVGSSGKVAYSSDGINWTSVTTTAFNYPIGSSKYDIYAIAYGGGKFVAGCEYGKIAYSSDGETWSLIPNGTGDGKSQLPGMGGVRAIAYGNGKFVAAERGAGVKAAYSTDGISWTAIEDTKFGDGLSYGIYAIVYGGSAGQEKFVAVGYNNGNSLTYSSNGVTWTAVPDSISGSHTINAIAYGGGKFVVGGYGGITAYSSDGITWTAITPTAFFKETFTSGSISVPVYYEINTIAYGNGTFVVGCSDGKMAYSSGL